MFTYATQLPGALSFSPLYLAPVGWYDSSDSTTITKAYQNLVATGSGTSGTTTITASATAANKVQAGMKLRIGGADIYTVSAVTTTTITTVETLTSTYGAGSAMALDRVSQWNDKSGSGYNATQSTALSQPIYTPSKQNSLATLTGDAAAATMVLPSGLYSIPNGDNTIFIVGNRTLNDANERRMVAMTKAGSQRYQLAFTSTQNQVNFLSQSASTNLVSVSGITQTNFNIFTGQRSSTTQYLQVNGGTASTNSNASSEPAIDAAALFSNGIGTTAFHCGNIGEIILYNRALNSSEISLVQSYLSTKWNITL